MTSFDTVIVGAGVCGLTAALELLAKNPDKRPNPFREGPIFFTGEACLEDNRESPGQMVGAWHAGRRVAAMVE